jgi:hypothetical protein
VEFTLGYCDITDCAPIRQAMPQDGNKLPLTPADLRFY